MTNILTIDQALQQAVSHHTQGQLQEAEALYRAILQVQINHPDANNNLGILAMQMNQPVASLPYFKAALEASPNQDQYWRSYIDALIQAGQMDVAREMLKQARQQGLQGEALEALAVRLEDGHQVAEQSNTEVIKETSPVPSTVLQNSKKKSKTKPNKSAKKSAQHKEKNPSPQQTNTLAALFNEGQFTEVISLAQAMTRRFPLHGFGWKILGATFKMMGRDEDALAPMLKAAVLLPSDFQVYSNLGVTFHDLGRLDEAEASCRRALEINPDYAEVHYNLGNTLKSLDRLDQAEASYRLALLIKPDYVDAYYNLGNILREQGRLDEAEASYQLALQVKPDYADAHHNLGLIFLDFGRLSEAEACYRRVLEIKPDHIDAHYNLGNLLRDIGQLDAAVASYGRALKITSGLVNINIHNNMGLVLNDFGKLDDALSHFRQALQIKPDFEIAFSNLLFTLNYHPDKSGEEIFEVYREYNAKFCLPYQSEWRPHNNSREMNRRLKIGYVSPDFRQHSMQHVLEPLLAHHDKQAVEVYAYAELVREDALTARYKTYVDQWIPTRGLSDAVLAERIRADGIDILVDLAGHTVQNRLQVFARRPAPVSVSWLGFGYSTGMTAIDYYLADDIFAPQGCEKLFSESPWRMESPSGIYRPKEGMGEVNILPALERGYVTFGTLSRAVRINHRTLRVWTELLKRVPNSRLVIDSGSYRCPSMQEMLAEKFAALGIGRERLEIGYHTPPWDILRGIDIGLDCFPHNSGTTIAESLYMGLPIVTLAGRPSVGRIGKMILECAGHPEWVAGSEDEYIEIVVALASDLGRLAQLRVELREEICASAMMDEPAFFRKVENAFREMWIIYCEKGE